MIELNKNEKEWIRICKGGFRKEYPFKNRWHETLKPLFAEHYGWNPDEDNNYQDYLSCIFKVLLDLYLKIEDELSSKNANLNEIFFASFEKRVSCDEELPIERAIHMLCALIQGNRALEEDGTKRYEF